MSNFKVNQGYEDSKRRRILMDGDTFAEMLFLQIYDPEMAEKMSKAPILFIVIGVAVIVVELIAIIAISRKLKKIIPRPCRMRSHRHSPRSPRRKRQNPLPFHRKRDKRENRSPRNRQNTRFHRKRGILLHKNRHPPRW